MLFSKDFPYPCKNPEIRIGLVGVHRNVADLSVRSCLGTDSPSSPGHHRSLRIRVPISFDTRYPDLVDDLVHALLIEECVGVEQGKSGGWRVVKALPPRNLSWKPHDGFDLVDWAIRNTLAIAVPVPDPTAFPSLSRTVLPGLRGEWVVLDVS